MSRIYQLQIEINQYESLKSNLNQIANSLTSASSCCEKLPSTLKTHYIINNDTNNGVLRSEKLRKEIKEKAEEIFETYIPAIDDKIEELKKEIKRIEEEERAEAERRARNSSLYRWW